MRTIFVVWLALLLIGAPTVGFAAFDDVTLTTDTVITAGGVSLSVTGSSAVVESITVDSESFSFVLLSGSELQISSSDKKVLATNSPDQFITNNECGSSSSVLKHSSTASGSYTITVTPKSSTCSGNATTAAAPTTSTSASSPGGGGIVPSALSNINASPSTVAQSTPTPAVSQAPVVAAPVSTPTASPTSVSAAFSRAFSPGATHSDVKRLQQLLNSDPETRIAESGIGAPGNETAYFGSLTTKAIQKFQVKYGVAKPGDVGYGNFGPKTRSKVEEVFSSGATPAPVAAPQTTSVGATPASFTKPFAPGATHSDIKRLQQLLNSDPDTRIAESGVGAPGNETAYFGSLTTKAIQKFQVKYGVAKPGDVGYGNFGPKTRAKIQEVFPQ